ncbi:MAG: LptA/OstA family protein [Candidatus Omnitrophota bacterium]|nr:LptA/OstA family protein [Candidatus Omnitrophota bacterium]
MMTNKLQNPNVKCLIAFGILALVATAGCAKKDSVAQAADTAGPAVSAPKTAVDEPKEIDQIKHQVMAFDLEGLADDGSKKWDVKGRSAETVTENQVKLNNITAGTYGKEAHATITADSGLYDKSKNNVRLEQNVKAVIENNQQSEAGFIGAPSAPGDASKPRKTKTIITCDAEVEFNYEKNQGYFNKNVHVVNEEGTIDSDRLTVYLDPATKTVMTIVAEGNVRIRRGENTTYSDKATYVASDKKIVLSGAPKLVIYQEGDLQNDLLGGLNK